VEVGRYEYRVVVEHKGKCTMEESTQGLNFIVIRARYACFFVNQL
jgi:hypothetical protein